MSVAEAVILGLVQGLAEFLPISSSGHLALLEKLFGIEGESVLAFAVLLHVGTLASVLAVYWKDVLALVYELCMVFKDLFTGKGLRPDANPTRKLGFLIIAATVPTALMGVLLGDVFSAMYLSLPVIGAGFLITGTILLAAERLGQNRKKIKDMKYRSAVFTGICQGVAICPGISRSGATLFGSLICGLDRASAVKFAFLLSLPSIMGSAVLEAPKAFAEGAGPSMAAPIAVGAAVAAIAGFFAIKTMIKVVSSKKLFGFSIYTWALGAAVLAYAFILA
ncbi:MAG: undecaprenyl-diphosphate phosphatase [Clostridiales bacterium]|nr:undecaprenyl-diphosphate phosphatase [Clostridiales bacterium]